MLELTSVKNLVLGIIYTAVCTPLVVIGMASGFKVYEDKVVPWLDKKLGNDVTNDSEE